nr:hypothetical protein [Tanacetum cinerariifolium]
MTPYQDRLDFVHALIDIKVNRPLKDTMVTAIPNVKGSSSYLHTIKVEYKCKVPRCGNCSVFVYDDIQCPKTIRVNLGADLMKQSDPNPKKNVAANSDGAGNKSLYKCWNESLNDESYDDDEYNTYDLSEEQTTFCDALDIKLCRQNK